MKRFNSLLVDKNCFLDQSNWIRVLKKLDALWIHDGNPENPHAELTSGKHSNGFFNATKVTENPYVFSKVCDDIISSFEIAHGRNGENYDSLNRNISQVIGSAMGAIPVAYEFASKLNAKFAFTEPSVSENGEKKMVLKRFKPFINNNHGIIIVEDVITTGGTTLKTIEEIRKICNEEKDLNRSNIKQTNIIAPYILTIVNRSGKTKLDGMEIFSLIDKEMPIWEPEECPLCKQGSKTLRPKDNWDELTGGKKN